MVCHAIAHLMESGGYEARIFDTVHYESAYPEADVVLITAGASPVGQDPAWLAGSVPVLKLVDTPEEKEALGDKGLLWPCAAEELRARISDAVGASASERPVP